MLPFSIRAINTAATAENLIHDDTVASQFGFRGALVPGVTIYGYMAAPVIEYFGAQFLERGAMDVRFRQPVYAGDEVAVRLELDEVAKRVRVEANASASAVAWIHDDDAPSAMSFMPTPVDRKTPSEDTLAPGMILGSLDRTLDLAASTITAPLDPMVHGVAQPAALLALANEIFIANYQLGPWIHVASEVRKFQAARDGEPLRISAAVEDRYERKGHQFVALSVDITGPRGLVEHIRHTAIWKPRRIAP